MHTHTQPNRTGDSGLPHCPRPSVKQFQDGSALGLQWLATCEEDPGRANSNRPTSETHSKEDPQKSKQEPLVGRGGLGLSVFRAKINPF